MTLTLLEWPSMVKWWNCEHLMRVFEGEPVNEKLFEKELRKCRSRKLFLSVSVTSRKRENVTNSKNPKAS